MNQNQRKQRSQFDAQKIVPRIPKQRWVRRPQFLLMQCRFHPKQPKFHLWGSRDLYHQELPGRQMTLINVLNGSFFSLFFKKPTLEGRLL